MKNELKILAPCGMLGYGYPMESFLNGINETPDAIIVDAGSTDAGPHKLGLGVGIVSRMSTKKDLIPMVTHGLELNIPVIISSAGGAGAKPHVRWTIDIVEEILKEKNLHAKIAVIWADIDADTVKSALINDKILPLGKSVHNLTEDIIDDTNSIVAQMGHEPIIEALRNNVDIIICGRAFDPAPFAAVGIYNGFDAALSYHLGKILECGALCTEPGTTKDCALGILRGNSFVVKSLNKNRKCTPLSVAAHTFYEKDHPYLLKGPGMLLNLESCDYIQIDPSSVEVRNSEYIETKPYYVKLEGARRIGYRTFAIAGIRDPLLIEKIDEVENLVKQQVMEYYADMGVGKYEVNFYNYGKNGVMGIKESKTFSGYEIGVLFEAIAENQEIASAICATLRSTFLHYGYVGRKSTSGNLAFPYAPSDVEFGPVYEFSVYHLMEVKNGTDPFRIEYLWR